MKIKSDQVFIIGDPELESEIRKDISDKFNKLFEDKSSLYLNSEFSDLGPYRFTYMEDYSKNKGYYCIKEIYSNISSSTITEKINVNNSDFYFMFINRGRLESSNISHYTKTMDLLKLYRSKSSK